MVFSPGLYERGNISKGTEVQLSHTEHRAYIGLVARGSGEADIIITFKRSLAGACIGMVWSDIGQM